MNFIYADLTELVRLVQTPGHEDEFLAALSQIHPYFKVISREAKLQIMENSIVSVDEGDCCDDGLVRLQQKYRSQVRAAEQTQGSGFYCTAVWAGIAYILRAAAVSVMTGFVQIIY